MKVNPISKGNKVVLLRPHWGVGGIATVVSINEDEREVRITSPIIKDCPEYGLPVPCSDVRRATRKDFESGIYDWSLDQKI